MMQRGQFMGALVRDVPKELREKINAGDLYALLSVCTDEELDPLVQTVIGRWTNFLEVSETYKANAPKHSLYYKELADEIRQFGGNTFRNVLRGGEGPSYDEIVRDVCKKLGIPPQKDDTVTNETNILELYLDRQWKALGEEDRKLVSAAIAKAASGKVSTPKQLLKTGALLALTRVHPIGWAATIFDLAEPAFKVTVPCVVHIAYLRRLVLEQDGPMEPPADLPAIAPPTPGEEVAAAPSAALVLANENDAPVLSLARVADPGPREWRKLSQTDEALSRLSPLLPLVPTAATGHELMTGNYMKVVLEKGGELYQNKEGFFRAFTVGKDGTTEHAKLFKPTELQQLLSVTAVWQIASFVVAQKHLADISQKLSEIREGIERVRRFQEAQRKSTLTGAIRYLQQVAAPVLSGELSSSIRQTIELHEANLLAVQDHILTDIQHETSRIQGLEGKSALGSESEEAAIREQQEALGDLYDQLLLCVRARGCGWQLLGAFPGEALLKDQRKRDIVSALAVLEEGGDLLTETDIKMRQKIRAMSSIWNSESTLNERRLALLKGSNALTARVEAGRRQLDGELQGATNLLAPPDAPVTMLLKIEDDRIVEMCPA